MSTIGSKEYKLAIRIAGTVDKTLYTSLSTSKALLNKQLTQLDSSFNTLNKGFNGIVNVAKKSFKAVATASVVATAAVAAVSYAAYSAGTEFESAFAGVKKTVDATEEEYDELRNSILEMAQEIPSTTTELAEVMEVAGQLGIATEDLTTFTETMVKLGVSTNMTAEDAATALARFANITGMDTSQYENLGSAIVDLGNNFATTEEEIVTMSTRLASTATTVGMSEADILGLSTAMSSVGIKAAAGASSMSKVLRKMQTAVETNSDSLEQYASVAGMTTEEFSTAFNDNATTALVAFIEGLDDTERNGKSAVQVLSDMGLTETRVTNTLLALTNSSDLMTEAIETANTAWEENTALTEEAEKRYETVDSQIQLLKNKINVLGIAIYDDMREPLVDLLEWFNDVIESFSNWVTGPNGVETWIEKITTGLPTIQRKFNDVADDLSPVIETVKTFMSYMLEHSEILVGLITAIAAGLTSYKMLEGIKNIVKFFATLTANPWTGAIIGITAFTGAVVGLIGYFSKLKKNMQAANLEEHFGDISLTAEELEQVAESILDIDDNLKSLTSTFDSAQDDLESVESDIESNVKRLNKYNWMVGIGMELTEDQQSDYKETIEDYVQNMNDWIVDQQYAVEVSLELLGLDSDEWGINDFYSNYQTELSNIGKELQEVVNEAFDDGLLTIDEADKIADLQQQMADIQDQLATSEFEAKLTGLETDYSGAALDSDTFQNLQEELNTLYDEYAAEYKEARDTAIAAAITMRDTGALSETDYQAAVDEANQAYLEKLAGLQSDILSFSSDSITDAYGTELTEISNEIESTYEYWKDYFAGYFDEEDMSLWSSDQLNEFYNSLVNGSQVTGVGNGSGLLDIMTQYEDSIENISTLLGNIDTENVESLLALFEDLGIEIPEEFETAVNSINEISQYTSIDGLTDVAMLDNADSEEVLNSWYELGTHATGNLIDGLNSSYSEAKTVVQNYKSLLVGLSSIKIEDFTDGATSLSNSISVTGHATGGIFSTPHLAQIAEAGYPESVIPIDGSANAVDLWTKTGQLLGMETTLDDVDLSGGTETTTIYYNPTLEFNSGTPTQSDIEKALHTSEEEFETLMDNYLKRKQRLAF